MTDPLVAEIKTLQIQLIAVLQLSNEVNTAQPHARREALEALHEAIQAAKPLLTVYAAELCINE